MTSQMNTTGAKAFDTAMAKGWWAFAQRPWTEGDAPCRDGLTMSPYEVLAHLAMVTTETSEAVECVRDDDYLPRENIDRPGKPEGLPSELADIVIRVAHLAHAMGIDLDAAIATKMAFNETRAHRHGGRRL